MDQVTMIQMSALCCAGCVGFFWACAFSYTRYSTQLRQKFRFTSTMGPDITSMYSVKGISIIDQDGNRLLAKVSPEVLNQLLK